MRVLIVVSMMECGGTPRSIAIIAKYFVEQGHQVDIIGVYGLDRSFYQLPSFVKYQALDLMPKCTRFLPRLLSYPRALLRLRREISNRKPDIVLSFLDFVNAMTLCALAGTGIPTIISERTTPSESPSNWKWKLVRNFSYRFADGIVAVSQRALDELNIPKGIPSAVIPGPFEPSNITSPLLSRAKIILAAGRFSPEKRFPKLIEAFAEIADQIPEWNLRIVGQGIDEQQMRNVVRKFQLNKRVEILPAIQELDTYYAQAQIYVLCSAFEGFPRVLAEAMLSGLAPIAVEAPGVTSFPILDEDSGILATNVESSLALAILRLTKDNDLRIALAIKAKQTLSSYLSIEKAIHSWNTMLRKSMKTEQ